MKKLEVTDGGNGQVQNQNNQDMEEKEVEDVSASIVEREKTKMEVS